MRGIGFLENNMGAIQKIGEFLGVKKFADAMASTGRFLTGQVDKDINTQAESGSSLQKLTYILKNEKDPNKKAQLQKLIQSHLDSGNVNPDQIDKGLNLSNKEIIGSGANVVMNMFTPGAFKGGAGSVIAKNAALGSGFGLGSGLEQNRDTSGIIGSTVGGGLIGAGIGVAGRVAKIAKDFVGTTAPEWMMNNAVRPALQEIKKNVKYGGETLGKQLLDEGVAGTPKKLMELSSHTIDKLEDELQSTLADSAGQIKREQIIPYVKDLVERKAGTPGMAGDVKRIQNIIESIPDSMTLKEANVMKRRIYKELDDVSYKLDAKLSTKASTLKDIAKGLKSEIENAVGDDTVKEINRKLSIYGKLNESMVDKISREMRNNGISLTDAVLLAGGDTTSILALLRHIGQGLETYGAQGLKKVNNIGTGVAGKTTKELLRRGTLNLP